MDAIDKRCMLIPFVTDNINGKRYGLSDCIPTHNMDIMKVYMNDLNCPPYKTDLSYYPDKKC